VVPTFFSFWSEPGDYIGGGGVRRFTPPFDTFNAACTGSQVRFTF